MLLNDYAYARIRKFQINKYNPVYKTMYNSFRGSKEYMHPLQRSSNTVSSFWILEKKKDKRNEKQRGEKGERNGNPPMPQQKPLQARLN
jgi:hypothetical protein